MLPLNPYRFRHDQYAHSDLPPDLEDNPELADIVERNICKLIEVRRKSEQSKSFQDRIADSMTAFSGSMAFVYLHIIWFAVWMVINTGKTPLKPFDPFPFGLLTMVVSLEAIFLSTFVLVSQNRMQIVADKRADLDLHINLLSEHEITRLINLMDAVADHLGVDIEKGQEMDDLKRDISPETILNEIDRREHTGQKGRGPGIGKR